MDLNREELEEMYKTMSLDDMAEKIGKSKSTLYYHMKKMGIACRTKKEAQDKHIKVHGHQRIGTRHSDESKEKISTRTRDFWESEEGKHQKEELSKLRREEWLASSSKERNEVLSRLQEASRPEPGELSNFGRKLLEFLSKHEVVSAGIQLTSGHISDIILEDRKVVIELILPIRIYGEQQKQKLEQRYRRLQERLNAVGYRVFIIEDKSNSISMARCNRVYEELCQFFKDEDSVRKIVS